MSKTTSRDGRVLLRKRKKKNPSTFLPQKALVVYAKLNGQPDMATRVIGSTLDDLLNNCTQILKLTSAARKLYLTDGTFVYSAEQLQNNPEVFVSQGEPFIDTMKQMKDMMAAKEMSFWGLNGLYLPKVKRTNSSSNPEMEQSKKVRRILVFGNGDYFLSDGFEIISDLKNMEEFKSLCDSKHSFNGHCKRVFIANGMEILDLNTLLYEDSFVWNPNSPGSVLGPVWVSSRDDIDRSAIFQYFRQTNDIILLSLRKEKTYLSELNAMSDGNLNRVHTSSIKSYSKKELEVRKKDSEQKVAKLEKDRDRFQNRLDGMSEGSCKETTVDLWQTECNYAKGTQGLRLKVYTNGQPEEKRFDFFFNVEKAKKGINDNSILFDRLLDDLSKNVHLTKANDHSRGILVRRLFTKDGIEIKDVGELTYDQIICVSHGENWINPKCLCLMANVHFMNEELQEQSGDLAKLKDFEVSERISEKHSLYNLPILQNKKSSKSQLMVSVFISEKNSNLSSLETWLFTKNGRIFLKHIPSLSLTLISDVEKNISIPAGFSKSKSNVQLPDMTYYPVQLCQHQPGNAYQLWEFTKSGQLCCKGFQTMFLSYLPISEIAPQDSFIDIVSHANICATELLPDPCDSYQRWGFKHLDQWKLCDMPNIDWHKAALIWPLKRDGSLNSDLKWPLEGNMIPCAPAITKFKLFSDLRFPIKLNVMRNNDHRNEKAVLVTGPDLTKLVRIHRPDKYETHCSNENLLRQEFEMFLANCTGCLGLPSAARKLFTKEGKELTTLDGLSNNDYVYVSMGEMWSSPEKTLTKIQLRSYTNKLTVDVERLKNFINLYRPDSEFVLGIRNNSMDEGALLEVQLLNDQSRRELQRIDNEDHQTEVNELINESPREEIIKYKSVHEKTCDAAKLRLLKNNVGSPPLNSDEITNTKDTKKTFEMISCINNQQFVYENSYITVSSNPKYGLYANDVGKNVSLKRIMNVTENTQYKWIVHKSGLIESVYYRGFVLTVTVTKMLPFQDKSLSEYTGTLVTLEKAVNAKYGNSLQRFNVVTRSGIIYPFFTNQIDKGVTSAILSSVCTKFVSVKAINQQGYMVEIKKTSTSEAKSLPICLSCVSILNGRYPTTPMDNVRESFICAYSGGFKVLRNVDLSLENAERTYQFYLKKLLNIREQLILKPCKNRVTAPLARNIKALLYKNGHGRSCAPQTVTAKSINQIMETATYLFNFQRPVRILYTETGAAIVDELSFANVMCNYEATDTSPKLCNPIIDTEENNEELNVHLSEDGSYFVVALGDSIPNTLYSIEIFISKVEGIRQFQKENQTLDLYFLINYEIFNNQINTDLFHYDDDFESEVTELTIKSSPGALRRLFNEDLSVLRMQLISATVISNNAGDEDMKLDIKSINAFADINLRKVAESVLRIDDVAVTETLIYPLISAETFQPTSAKITVEISVKMLSSNPDKTVEEFASVDSESIIMQPNYVPTNNPIELWASVGEPFYFPLENESKSPRKTRMDQLKLEMYNKKFLLRNLKGERMKKLEAGTLEATGDGNNPVMIKGNWMFPSNQEKELIKQIEDLEKAMTEKKPQTVSSNIPLVSGSLYIQKQMKNCMVYLNGDKETNAVSVWGETIYEIMNNAARILQMKKIPKFLFKKDGQLVTRIEEIRPEMQLALSHHSTFISAENARLQCEIKANWGRARSKYGQKSTELQVQHRPITVIDVDPFEPPDIMKPRETVAKENKTFKVFENGQSSSTAVSISGNSFSSVLRQATEVLKLNASVKCFYTIDGKRIMNFKEILNDDVLAASVTGKGFFKNEDD